MSRIVLNHVAVYNRSASEARKFYGQLLNLKESYQFSIDAALAFKIFGFKTKLQALVFEGNNFHLEVFLAAQKYIPVATAINHICVEVDNRDLFLQQCRNEAIMVTEINKEHGVTVFIKDYSENLLEIKESKGKNRLG